jgi:hypothetical protein
LLSGLSPTLRDCAALTENKETEWIDDLTVTDGGP